MIDARELRIGNIVEPITMSPIMVTGITQQKTLDGIFTLIFVDYGESFLQEHLNPVPLTEEWMLRFSMIEKDGFADGIGSYNFWDNEEFGYCLVNLAEGLYGVQDCQCHPFRYVHQFQNVHFLITGKELTIQHL